MYTFRERGNIVTGKFIVIVLALFSALNFENLLFAQSRDAGARSTQATTGPQTGQSATGKRRSRKPRRITKQNECMTQSSTESTKPDGRESPVKETPALILDPTDREPGPPKEIIPEHIDPAEMPAIKKSPKKKTNP